MYYDVDSYEFYEIIGKGYTKFEELEKALEDNIANPSFKKNHSEEYVTIVVGKLKEMLEKIREHKKVETGDFKLTELPEFGEKMYEITGFFEGINLDICTYRGIDVEYRDEDQEEIDFIIPDCESETLFHVEANLLTIEEYAKAYNVPVNLIKKLVEEEELDMFVDEDGREGISEMQDLPIMDDDGNVITYRHGGFGL